MKPLLVYEPRTEGHHLGWLRYILEDLLSAGANLSLAADLRPAGRAELERQLADLLPQVKLLSAYDENGRRHAGGNAASIAYCLRASGAEAGFMCALDEVASSCWRRAAVGLLPPAELRGRIGGIYHRPSFLQAPWNSVNAGLKRIGFRRLVTGGWFQSLFILDEYLAQGLRAEHPAWPIFFLPNPCPEGYGGEQAQARVRLGVPPGKRVFLFYGTGSRRKGLHLATKAMLRFPAEHPSFLLCAGQQDPEGATAAELDKLAGQGRALLMNRYVSTEEEKLCFAACDAVLLPYQNHFGTSDVLSRAMAAGKPVVVSDEQLLGRLTRERRLGLVFPPGDVMQLGERIAEISAMQSGQLAPWRDAAATYAREYSRGAFKNALLRGLETSNVKGLCCG